MSELMIRLSSELAMEDFLRKAVTAPLRITLERCPLPPRVLAANRYQSDTDRLMHGLQTGTYMGIRLAFESCSGLPGPLVRRAA